MLIRITFDPVSLQLGGLELGWHGLFTALGVAAGIWLGVRIATAKGVPREPLSDVATWAVVGGIIGARLFHVLDHLSYFAQHPLEALAVWQGGIAVYGAFIGGILGGYLVAQRHRLPAWALLDAAAPGLLVGQMIGRLGCLSNGDAWGAPTGGQWGVVYLNPNDLLPPDLLGVPTHPYPVYEIVAVGALLTLLWAGRRAFTRPGQMFLVATIGYAAIRFGLTFFRQEPVLFLGLQEAQVIAVVTAAVAAALLLRRRGGGAAVDATGSPQTAGGG